jgi:hypothetical protein
MAERDLGKFARETSWHNTNVPLSGPVDILGSSTLGLAFEVLGLIAVAVLIGVVVFVLLRSPNRSNEQASTGRTLHPMRLWHPGHYSLALGHLQVLCRHWKDGEFHPADVRGRTTEWDLIRWILQLSLTCAASMIPQSLGKANLFRVSQVARNLASQPELTLYSSEFDGVFSVRQLVDPLDHTRLRDVRYVWGSDDHPAAVQCVIDNQPLLQSLQKRSLKFDNPERDLGITHVLAIPLVRSFGNVIPDQPVSITVDFRFSKLTSWLVDRGYRRRTVIRRAEQLASTLVEIEAIKDPRFLPPSDARPETGMLLGGSPDLGRVAPGKSNGGGETEESRSRGGARIYEGGSRPRPNEARRDNL